MAAINPACHAANAVVAIDLFVCRCIEGVQLTRTARPVTYLP
jgi:hypothetical protein